MATKRSTRASAGDVEPFGRPTRQRMTVLQALMDTGGLVSAQTLHNTLAADDARVGLSTVYRTLTALAGAGRADVVRDSNGERLFRYRPDAGHRHYLRCSVCGLSVAVDSGPVEDWAERTAHSSGFTSVRHTVELTGVCPECGSAGEPHCGPR